MNHDTHTMMIQQNATVRGLEEPLTVDMVYPANASFIFIHLLCLCNQNNEKSSSVVFDIEVCATPLHQPAT